MHRGLLTVAVFVLVAAACGDAAETTTTAAPATTMAPTTTTTTTTTTTVAATVPPTTVVETTTTTTDEGSFASSCPLIGRPALGAPTKAGVIAGYDPVTGNELWSIPIGASFVVQQEIVGDTYVALLADGVLVALDADLCFGRWELVVFAPVAGFDITDDGLVVAAGESELFAVDLETGDVAWQVPWRSGRAESIGYDVAIDGDTVVAVDRIRRRLLGFGLQDGAELFDVQLPGRPDDLSPPTFVDGIVYVVGGGDLVAIDTATTERAWEMDLGFDSSHRPVVADDVVYVAGDGRVGAFGVADGAPLWDTALDGEAVAEVMIDHDEVHVLDVTGALFHLDPTTGRRVAKGSFGETAFAEPASRMIGALVLAPQPDPEPPADDAPAEGEEDPGDEQGGDGEDTGDSTTTTSIDTEEESTTTTAGEPAATTPGGSGITTTTEAVTTTILDPDEAATTTTTEPEPDALNVAGLDLLETPLWVIDTGADGIVRFTRFVATDDIVIAHSWALAEE